eukprot:1336822-Rhodomonas_salina.1
MPATVWSDFGVFLLEMCQRTRKSTLSKTIRVCLVHGVLTSGLVGLNVGGRTRGCRLCGAATPSS